MTTIYNHLPNGFQNWNQLYLFLKNRISLNNPIIKIELQKGNFEVLKVNEQSKPVEVECYSFDVDFIKARCFEERNQYQLDFQEILEIRELIYRHSVSSMNSPTIEKLSKTLNLIETPA